MNIVFERSERAVEASLRQPMDFLQIARPGHAIGFDIPRPDADFGVLESCFKNLHVWKKRRAWADFSSVVAACGRGTLLLRNGHTCVTRSTCCQRSFGLCPRDTEVNLVALRRGIAMFFRESV